MKEMRKKEDDGNEAEGRDKRSPRKNREASRGLFCCQTTPAPTSTAPCGEDVLDDVLGQPWEESMSEQITTFCQITTDVFDVGGS